MDQGSPCVGWCQLDELKRCLGCYRTLEEIASWSRLDASQRQAVWAKLAERRRTAAGSNPD
ncbi:DUF1289 domain-containing protein [Ferrimonas gelatinilytica]|uniref:DUF1289 domain-containing protein n=1 Tax=Ferrimonas gelatinilytica TaxID=1255257 RepID=A0ABP9SD59_9GAMM